jgi:general secretion pathway protein F
MANPQAAPMPQFRYRAVTHAGEIVVGEVDASSREEVVRRIEYLGHLTIDAEIAATGILNRGRPSIGKLPRSRDVSIYLRQLSLLIGAGPTLEAALQTLGDDASKGLAAFANGLRASISAGESFAEALERHPSIIAPTYVAMVRVGEASGKLEAVLRAVMLDILGIDAVWSGRQAVVRFHPDGASTGAVLKLSREKAEYEIRVNWCTGGVAIAP